MDPLSTQPAGAQSSYTILVVEDTAIQAKKLQFYLEKFGHRVTWAENGRKAFEILQARGAEFDLIISDIQMPEMDGLEATRQLRVLPAFAATPIIALTALAMPGDRERCLEAGVNEYMTKPLRLKTLVETIQRLL